MSGYDLNVWFSESRLTAEQAAEIRQHVGSDWVIFGHDPHLDGFLVELRRRYPDATQRQSRQSSQWGSEDPFLKSVDDPKPPPRSAEELREAMAGGPTVWYGEISQQGMFVAMSVLWERALEVAPTVLKLAKDHHLSVLDEDGQLIQPDVSQSAAQPAIFRLSLTLHIAGKKSALDMPVTDGHTTLAHQVVATRLEARLIARSFAKTRHEIGYHLDDPQCLAQAYEWAPVATGLPSANFESF